MKRAAIYARKSTDDPAADSVRRQVDHAREAAARLGLAVVEEYVCIDDGISGAEFKNRPGLMRLLAGAGDRAFGVVIVSEPSRLGRDRLRTELVLQELRDAGVRVYAYLTNETIQLDTPESRFLVAARGLGDEMEREKGKLRTRDAHRARAKAGFVTGGVVFGYRNVPVYSGTDSSGNPRRSHVVLEIDDAQAATLREIFAMRARGDGLRAIARALNARAVPPPRKGTGSWSPGCIRSMLRNERYLGRLVWGRCSNVDRAGRTRLRATQEPAKWITVEKPELRIIDDETWAHVRAFDRQGDKSERSSGRGQAVNRTPAALLTGLSSCAMCEGPIRIAGSKKRERCYGCGYNNDRGVTVCRNNLLESVGIVDRRLLEDIEIFVLAPEARHFTLEHAMLLAERRSSAVVDELDILRDRLVRVGRELANLVRAIEYGNPPRALIEGIRAREEERATLEASIREAEALQALPRLNLKRIEAIIEKHVQGIDKLLRSDLATARATLSKMLAGRVIFHPEQAENGERTYLLEAKLTLENFVPRASMSGYVPDGTRSLMLGSTLFARVKNAA